MLGRYKHSSFHLDLESERWPAIFGYVVRSRFVIFLPSQNPGLDINCPRLTISDTATIRATVWQAAQAVEGFGYFTRYVESRLSCAQGAHD